MEKYTNFNIDIDIFKHRKHIYYLEAQVGTTNQWNAIASYSLKTKRLIIKCANDFIPEYNILKEFVEYCEQRGEWKC